MRDVFITQSAEETQKIGENIVKSLKKTTVVALYGDLGSGKTTFVQGLAKGLGIKEKITSPTFNIIRQYKLKAKSSKGKSETKKLKALYHIDLYRIESTDLKNLGIEEILNNKESLVVIEWAEKMKEFLPKEKIDIYFEYSDENKRKIIIINEVI